MRRLLQIRLQIGRAGRGGGLLEGVPGGQPPPPAGPPHLPRAPYEDGGLDGGGQRQLQVRSPLLLPRRGYFRQVPRAGLSQGRDAPQQGCPPHRRWSPHPCEQVRRPGSPPLRTGEREDRPPSALSRSPASYLDSDALEPRLPPRLRPPPRLPPELHGAHRPPVLLGPGLPRQALDAAGAEWTKSGPGAVALGSGGDGRPAGENGPLVRGLQPLLALNAGHRSHLRLHRLPQAQQPAPQRGVLSLLQRCQASRLPAARAGVDGEPPAPPGSLPRL
uniref:Uncharacterized protein n=1 Tax=Strombidium rassoulzadegani TaxID=1082188 RepID=A0A7S3CKY6_9SPIT|mmetsp:Transcript_14751/g.25091  ORF Transcript_14751/g.25091 Transcript_14751/m.25091 type:complete len:275 (+) Transcript_14751:1511-2335(+)